MTEVGSGNSEFGKTGRQMTDSRGQRTEVRGHKKENRIRNVEFEKDQSPPNLLTSTLYYTPYALSYNLISGICNLFSVMSDVLLYALCHLLYAPFARNPQLTTSFPVSSIIAFQPLYFPLPHSTFHLPPSPFRIPNSTFPLQQHLKRRNKRFISGFGQQGVLGDGAGAMLRRFGACVQMRQERVAYLTEMLLMGGSQIIWNLNQQGIFFQRSLKVSDTCPTISASSPERLFQPDLCFLVVRLKVRF